MDRNQQTPKAEESAETKKIDVTVPQVAASAVAAVIAALIAGRLGVYGTFIGAGLISVVATTGGPVLQHFFHRTGSQVRTAAAQARTRAPGSPRVLRPGGARGFGSVPAAPPSAGGGRTGALSPQPGSDVDDFGAPSTHGSRRGRVLRLAFPAALVFAIAIGGITLYEAASGTNVSGGKDGTTSLSDIVGPQQDGGGGTEQGPDGQPGEPGDDGTGGGTEGPSAPSEPAPDSTGPGTGSEGTGNEGDREPDAGTTPDPSVPPGTPSVPSEGEPDGTGHGGEATGDDGSNPDGGQEAPLPDTGE